MQNSNFFWVGGRGGLVSEEKLKLVICSNQTDLPLPSSWLLGSAEIVTVVACSFAPVCALLLIFAPPY